VGLYSRAQLEKDLAAVERFDAEVSAKVARGEISGFAAVELGRDVQRKIASLRMKLVNAGQMIADLRSAKEELATAESETQTRQAKFRLRKAWAKIRFNSDGRSSDDANATAAQDGAPSPLGVSRSREISLDSPEAQGEIHAAQKAGKRIHYRPGGRNVVVIFED
jgi:hypothetical protein